MELILHIPTTALSDKLKKYLESEEYQEMVQDFGEEVWRHSDSPLRFRKCDWKIWLGNGEQGEMRSEKTAVGELVGKKKRKEAKEKKKIFSSYVSSLQSKASLSPFEKKLQKKRTHSTIVESEYNGLVNQVNQNPKESKTLTENRTVNRFLKLWADLGLRTHKVKSKTFEDTVWKIEALLNGELYTSGAIVPFQHIGKSFNFSQFLFSSERFAKAALDRAYFPNEKAKQFLRRLTLGEFLYYPYSADYKNKSFFLYYLDSPPKLISYTQDLNPELTDALMESYIKHIHNSTNKKELLQSFLDAFRRASNGLSKILTDNKDRIHPMMVTSLKDQADILVKTALKVFSDPKRISPFTLTSNFLMERIPVYMQNQGFFLAGRGNFSIYSYKGNGGHANSEKEKGGNGTGATNSNGNGGQHKVPSGHSSPL